MIKAIVYKSNSGFTKEYALMLSKKLVLPVYDIKEANKSLCKNDEIIYMGWIMAGNVQGLNKAKKYAIKAIVAVGMTYDEKQEKEIQEKVKAYNSELVINIRGGFYLDRLHGIYKFMMKVMGKVLGKVLREKENKTEEDKQTLLMIEQGASYVDEANLDRVITWYNNRGENK